MPGIRLPPAQPIGESWEVSDRDEEPSIVAEGPLVGTTLRDLVARRRDELLGRARATAGGRFPLLVKYLDTAQPLSIQVHPLASNPATGEEAKSEAWYFLHAEPESRIWLGLEAGVTREALAKAAGSRAMVPLVREWPVHAGETVFVRGGTVHAIGPGVTVLEVQENSDTTHRLYDWDRVGLDGHARSIHVEHALRSTDLAAKSEGPRVPEWRAVTGGRRALLTDCALFEMQRVEFATAQDDDTEGVAVMWAILDGTGKLDCANGVAELAPGDVWLVPASVGRHRIEASSSTLTAVRIATRP